MAKTQEELNTLKAEYETLNNKLKELSDDELKTVVGGCVDMEYSSVGTGRWYTTSIHPDHILKVLKQSESQLNGGSVFHSGVLFAKYWYDGVNAWNHGTCSSVGSERYNEVNAPANIHDDIMYVEKPFK